MKIGRQFAGLFVGHTALDRQGGKPYAAIVGLTPRSGKSQYCHDAGGGQRHGIVPDPFEQLVELEYGDQLALPEKYSPAPGWRMRDDRRPYALADDVYDDLPDSFFMAPPIDSDEHIIYEILQERKEDG